MTHFPISKRITKAILHLVKRYPQKVDGKIRWIFTGGLAAAIITEGNVDGYHKLNALTFNRFNKDIDIFSFDSQCFGFDNIAHRFLLVEHNLSLIDKDPAYLTEKGDLHIDLVNGYHFHTRTPSTKDIVSIKIFGIDVLAVSPEFIFYSKLFPVTTPQQKHYRDCLRIAYSYNLDYNEIISIASKSPYGHILTNYKANDLEEAFLKGTFYEWLVESFLNDGFQEIGYLYDLKALPPTLLFVLSGTAKHPPTQNLLSYEISQQFQLDPSIGYYLFRLLTYKIERPDLEAIRPLFTKARSITQAINPKTDWGHIAAFYTLGTYLHKIVEVYSEDKTLFQTMLDSIPENCGALNSIVNLGRALRQLNKNNRSALSS